MVYPRLSGTGDTPSEREATACTAVASGKKTLLATLGVIQRVASGVKPSRPIDFLNTAFDFPTIVI